MELKPMYPAQKDSPSTFLLGDISAVDVLLVVGNAAIIPQTVPFPLTIGINRTITETVMVTTINLENNQLTVTRGNPAYDWPAGTTCARVFTAKNLNDLQDNVGDIGENLTTVQETVATHNTDISTLKTTVGGADSGLVKGLADEIVRAEAAEGAEVTRASGVEADLNTAKINRTELAQVITDWVYSADGTKVLVTITRYNASTQQTTEYTRTIPVVSDATMGVMTPEAYNEIASLRNDVNALINLGGRFIGVSFATKVALNEYVVPASVKTGDFTYVIDDETKDGATTRYVRNGSVWDFTFVVNYDPVGLADDETAGLVKSTDGTVFGKIFVETDGTMSLVGWDETLNDLSSDVDDVQDEVTAHKADTATHINYAVATGTANVYAVSLNPAPTTYTEGMAIAVKIPADSTSASTINVNGLGAKGIKKANGTDATNLKAGGIYTMRYDGVNFILQGEGASGNATASDLLSGKTATTDAGEIIGTIPSKGAATITPGTTNQTIAAGQFLSGAQTIAGDANLVAGNIVKEKSIFGVAGTLVSASGDATASDLLSGKTATTDAGEITGTMSNRGAVSQSLAINGAYTIPAGYHNGSGQVTQSIPTKGAATITPRTTNQTIAAGQYLSGAQTIAGSADLIPANIVSGKNIFGVAGGAVTGGAKVKSVQTIKSSIGGTDTTKTHIISAVNVTNSVVMLTAAHTNTNYYTNPSNSSLCASLSNSTTLKIERTSGGNSVDYIAYVVEFETGVTIQQGLSIPTKFAFISDMFYIPISSVDTSRSIILCSFRSGYNSSKDARGYYTFGYDELIGQWCINVTSVMGIYSANYTNFLFSWYIITFN